MPARDFLDSCPENVRAKIVAVAKAVAAAPPPQFGGGGWWEAMHGDMGGYYEIRADRQNTHYRVFCLLESDGSKLDRRSC